MRAPAFSRSPVPPAPPQYVGYSIATGAPSEDNCYASADAAYAYLLSQHTPPESIVPFGRSLGSGPACHLAAAAAQPCGGLLLQSPLLSGACAIFGEGTATLGSCVDIFKNYQKIGRARCRVCVMHGTADRVVPCWNGRKLLEKAADGHEPLWCNGRGHNDMPEETCLAHAAGFLDFLSSRETNKPIDVAP